MHSENIPSIEVTFDVSKFEKSIEINDEHLENILLIIETSDESNFDKFISLILLQSENIDSVLVIDTIFQIIFTVLMLFFVR